MKYPFLSIITILLLLVGVSNAKAQNCTPAQNFDFVQITNTSIEMSWDPHLSAVGFELEYFFDGVSVGLYSLPGSATSHIYIDNTGLLPDAQSVSASIRVECPDPDGWSDLVTGNTETDVYDIEFRYDPCFQAVYGESFIYDRNSEKKYNLYCYCSVRRDYYFINGFEIGDDIPKRNQTELNKLLEECEVPRLLPLVVFDLRIPGVPQKWDNSAVNNVRLSAMEGNVLEISSEQAIVKLVVYDVLGKQILMQDQLLDTKVHISLEQLNFGDRKSVV